MRVPHREKPCVNATHAFAHTKQRREHQPPTCALCPGLIIHGRAVRSIVASSSAQSITQLSFKVLS